uniref:CSC1/OSCA1-like 7TM region domain-containing protein n=1 Tax=Fagus sylvatica TaxID=28930 RepID=A0A2N9GUF8_FAGSY
MATLKDIEVAAAINILSAFAFFVAFAILRLQPINDRVYFPKWYLKGLRNSPLSTGAFVGKFVNLDFRAYLRFLNWMPAALQMPEPELIEHAGLDSAVYLRIYLVGFWTHLVMAYVFTFWTCYVLKKEYEIVASMRLHFLASEQRRPDQFTVLVRNVPPDPDESVNELVEHFFLVNHPEHYLTHQTGFLGLCGDSVDSIDFYTSKIEGLSEEIASEREKIMNNPKHIMPAAFVSFKTRWGAAVCAQTQQSRNPTIWLTEWAPEPRDIYWDNLAIPYVSLTIRRLIVAVAFFFLTFFFMIPIAFVQSLANIEGIEKALPFLKPLIEFIPKTIGVSIPMKATFFITYIMVDGWAGIAGEILRLKPLIMYHLKNFLLVKTEKDRQEAMDPGSLGFNTGEPQIQLYFLLGLVYAVVTPILLPFIIVFFGLAYVVYRHQIINVYNQEYESAAAFWPDVHGRIIVALIVSQLLLMGLLSTKQAAQSTPFFIALPVLTIWFHIFCKGRYEPAFVKYPLQEAMMKDTLERAKEPNLNLKGFLQSAYIHPVFKGEDDSDSDAAPEDSDQEPKLIQTRRQSRRNTPLASKHSGSLSSLLPEAIQEH